MLYDPEALSHTASGSSLLTALPEWSSRLQPVTGRVLAAASQTESPGGILAVLRHPVWPPLSQRPAASIGVLLDRLGDPGNAGTVLRTADAFDVGYVATLPGSTELYAPKVVRAGMGAHFRLPIYQHVSWEMLRSALPHVALIAADARHGTLLSDLQWPNPALLVIGNEASGLDPEIERYVHEFVRIPLRPGVESLNAAVAAAILLYAGSAARSLLGDERYK